MRVYTVNLPPTGIATGTQTGTLIQIACGAGVVIRLIRAWCKQTNIVLTQQQNIGIKRTTTAGTVSSVTPVLHDLGDSASQCVGGTALTGNNASAEGTTGDILVSDAFNLQFGWEKIWLPDDEPIIVGPTNPFISLYLPDVPTGSITMSAGLTFGEIGS